MPGTPRLITFEGQTLPIAAWARLKKINPSTLYARIRAGQPPERALGAVRQVRPLPRAAPVTVRVPRLGRHASGRARVTWRGQTIYLGRYGTPEAAEAYAHFVQSIEAGAEPVPQRVTVAELLERFWQHADTYYRSPDGAGTGQLYCYRQVVGIVGQVAGPALAAAAFTPGQLQEVKRRFLRERTRKGTLWSRGYVNDQLDRARRIWSWGVGEALVPHEVSEALTHVANVRKRCCANPEGRKLGPVAWAVVEQTLPFLPGDLADLVRVHWLAGCRAAEAVLLRPGDLVREGDDWTWTPERSKTNTVYCLGPRAQAILAPLLEGLAPTAYVFRGPVGHARRGKALGRWSKSSYGTAVRRACRQAGVKWVPRQVRKGRATEIELRMQQAGRDGLGAAQAVLGHTTPATTRRHYAEQRQLAREVQREMG